MAYNFIYMYIYFQLLDSLFEPSSSSNGLASKVKKVFQSSPTPKKKPRAQSLNTTLGIGKYLSMGDKL